MYPWWPRILIAGLLVVVVGLPVVLSRPEIALEAGDDVPTVDETLKLIILTPHNEQIRFEFARAFNLWRKKAGRSGVVFDWRTGGGTSDLLRSVFDQFGTRVRTGREDEGIGCDLFFGGGDYAHNKLARPIVVERDGRRTEVRLTVPPDLPAGMLERVFPEPAIGGEPLYHARHQWVGVALASFGIVYNRDALEILGMPEPHRWSDLADQRYLHWVALADPAHSGSIAATYNVILRRAGWCEGWRILRRVFANARYFTSSAGKVPVDVSAGEAAAGMCIDFYGRYQAGAIGGRRIGYVDPEFATAITADPISILRGAPHPSLANEFVQWLLTPEAQDLWQKRRGVPGGPAMFELRRLPIRRDVYGPRQDWTDRVNPYAIARAFPPGTPNYYGAVAPISHAMAIDIHHDLVEAWKAIVLEPDGDRKQWMVATFDWMPEELRIPWPDPALETGWCDILENGVDPRREQVVRLLRDFTNGLDARLNDRGLRAENRLNWTLAFRRQYRKVLGIARGEGGDGGEKKEERRKRREEGRTGWPRRTGRPGYADCPSTGREINECRADVSAGFPGGQNRPAEGGRGREQG